MVRFHFNIEYKSLLFGDEGGCEQRQLFYANHKLSVHVGTDYFPLPYSNLLMLLFDILINLASYVL